MKGSDAFYLMMGARDYLGSWFRQNISDVDLSPDYKIGNGEIDRYRKLAIVGVQEFVERPDDDFPMSDVTKGVVALFHETYGHGLQYRYMFLQDNMLSKALAFSDYACRASRVYYGYEYEHVPEYGPDVYREHLGRKFLGHPHEMAAEYAGIKTAHQFLNDKYGPIISNKLICNYVNDNVRNDWSFVHPDKPYTNIDEILRDFHREFPECVLKNRDYDPQDDFMPGDKTGGPFVQYANRRGKQYLLKKSQKDMDGIRQDAIQTAAVGYECGLGGELLRLPVFKHVNFDMDKMVMSGHHPMKRKPKAKHFQLSCLDQAFAAAEEIRLNEEGTDDTYEFS